LGEDGIVSEDKNKPVLDEQTLDKLLEAAFILQEHHREMGDGELSTEFARIEAEERTPAATSKTREPRSPEPAPADCTLMLAQIVETQHQIQARQFAPDDAMTLVADRVIEIARAGGAAIGRVEGTKVHYRAISGLMTPPKGAIVRVEESLSIPCVKTSQVLRCPNVDRAFLVDPEQCRRRGIASMIAVPVFHEGGVVGALELYYSSQNAFTEQDVQTCQLMAGLITEALARDEEITWKKSVASERAAMLEALEKLKPNLAALLGQSTASDSATAGALALGQPCRKCGHKIVGEEQFCGQCGSPSNGDLEPANLQSKVASLWEMQEARKKESPDQPARPDRSTGEDGPEQLPGNLGKPFSETSLGRSIAATAAEHFETSDVTTKPSASAPPPAGLLNPEAENRLLEDRDEPAQASAAGKSDALAWAKTSPPVDPTSDASARAFLEQLAAANRAPSPIRFWNNRRGDIYLGVAVIFLVCVVCWGIRSGHSVGATAAPNSAAAVHHKSHEANLSMFDRLLIHLGLADPPDAPEDKGNPAVEVWIDSHSGLYYCPGTDLYGKTPKGKLATQREAQLDQFQPAYRKACN